LPCPELFLAQPRCRACRCTVLPFPVQTDSTVVSRILKNIFFLRPTRFLRRGYIHECAGCSQRRSVAAGTFAFLSWATKHMLPRLSRQQRLLHQSRLPSHCATKGSPVPHTVTSVRTLNREIKTRLLSRGTELSVSSALTAGPTQRGWLGCASAQEFQIAFGPQSLLYSSLIWIDF
jgi:hypothetical protein